MNSRGHKILSIGKIGSQWKTIKYSLNLDVPETLELKVEIKHGTASFQ